MSEPIFVENLSTVTAISMSSDITSDSIEIKEIAGYAIQAVWSAGSTPVGSMKLQASIDNTNFTDVDGSTLAVSGNTGSNMWNVELPRYAYVRMVYTRTSGSGTLNARISTKRN